jgi:SNF2 family DNA or RNA helicase
MGLGKTVITLGLIIKNPAPALPSSGSSIAELDNYTSTPWDKDLYSKTTPSSSKKRGSVLSRGTLVICPVSLVGQWISEAKSKLSDPGHVYAYYGTNRKRDARLLSEKSIVVTTFETVSKDDSYHRSKSKEVDYCPPLEQVRWWRIVADEGHSLRDHQTNRCKAVFSLVADHKWLVTGESTFIRIPAFVFDVICSGSYLTVLNRTLY